MMNFDGINEYFNRNIEIIRDITVVIGSSNMVNSYGNLSWGITVCDCNIVVLIEDMRYRTDLNHDRKYVCVEFKGDGVMTIRSCDAYGNPDGKFEIFDTHSYTRISPSEAFKEVLVTKFDIHF